MNYLPTDYQTFIHVSRYARWRDDLGRREQWDETVDRYFDFFVPHLNENNDAGLEPNTPEVVNLMDAIYELKAMPSMRCLMTAGPALARDHVAAYNCAYRAIDNARAFDEILFVLMCAAGMGFSVERQYINNLPDVPETLEPSTITITVRDSKRGWAEALRELIALLYAGRIPDWDTSHVRGPGSRLKTMGGRASGPEPLIQLFKFVVQTFQNAVGRKLTSLECHDIVCQIGECVVVGGVRRSALISLSNLSDQRMRDAKSGEWYMLTPYRSISNNSVAYTERPEVGQFMEEWLALYHSKSGERGIFNRQAAHTQAMRFGRRRGYWDEDEKNPIEFGTNPCSEIILRSKQFCNLTSAVIRADDEPGDMAEKVRAATILGTWQASLTNFRYLTKKWKDNCEEERLLGVSMTGIMDHPTLSGRNGTTAAVDVFEYLREVARETNREWADRLGINPATAITCVKPEGTVSQLVDASSGLHDRWAPYYVRRVRQDLKDPLTRLMMDEGVPHEQDIHNPANVVFEFPVKAPETASFRNERSAVDQLEHWKLIQDHWCEHKPSVTVYLREEEWPEVGGWVWNNFDKMSGVSFLPHSDHVYKQAPYEDLTEDEYKQRVADMPEVDWTAISQYEKEDQTVSSRDFACVAGQCEIT